MKTFKILGLLLTYPEPELVKNLDDIMAVLDGENIVPKKSLKKVHLLGTFLKEGNIYDIQENYVGLFDRGRAHCLQLFEHIHGESRDRGQAMVNLVETYQTKGLYLDNAELPDYLPLFLEYLSLCPADEAIGLLGDPINVIAAIGIKLKKRGSLYAHVFEALVALSKVKPDSDVIRNAEEAPVHDMTLAEMDKEWEDTAAFDNSNKDADGCNSCDVFSGTVSELEKSMMQDLRGGQ